MGDQKNLILAIVASVVILFAYQMFFQKPHPPQTTQQQAKQTTGKPSAETGKPGEQATGALPVGGDTTGVASKPVNPEVERATALKASPRLKISSPDLVGSIDLKGARIDDVSLRKYRVTLDPNSPMVELLHPVGTSNAYYAQFGWVAQHGSKIKVPDGNSVWTANHDELTPSQPVVLRWDNGAGLVFEQMLSLDKDYMFTVTQRVRNTGAGAVSLLPYGLISRTGTPHTLNFYILHEGLLGVVDNTLHEIKYKDLVKEGSKAFDSTGGWMGITDKYWLAALVPDQKSPLHVTFRSDKVGTIEKYQTDFLMKPHSVPQDGTMEVTNRLFAGAKQVPVLDRYEDTLHIPRFDLAVDFGWFYFLTKPIFYALLWLEKYIGNLGLAILVLTVGIKALFFPLANKSYRAMSKMKALQPKMQAMKERYGEDRQRMNQELMALYKKEGVNPAAGCLPMVIQIPVFFSLYKVLFVTIEMRHAPFYGWIHDLSAPDPLGLLTLFGLFPWHVPAALHVINIGLWPLIMGCTMFLQQRLNPQPTDAIQAKIFMFMPIIFTFILAKFPAGLVIYWAWNNVLSMAQQWVIMKRMGVKRT